VFRGCVKVETMKRFSSEKANNELATLAKKINAYTFGTNGVNEDLPRVHLELNHKYDGQAYLAPYSTTENYTKSFGDLCEIEVWDVGENTVNIRFNADIWEAVGLDYITELIATFKTAHNVVKKNDSARPKIRIDKLATDTEAQTVILSIMRKYYEIERDNETSEAIAI
jgi:hypothetical protein